MRPNESEKDNGSCYKNNDGHDKRPGWDDADFLSNIEFFFRSHFRCHNHSRFTSVAASSTYAVLRRNAAAAVNTVAGTNHQTRNPSCQMMLETCKARPNQANVDHV